MNQFVTGAMIKRLRESRKLYPAGNARARFRISGTRCFCYYCNRHSLFKVTL